MPKSTLTVIIFNKHNEPGSIPIESFYLQVTISNPIGFAIIFLPHAVTFQHKTRYSNYTDLKSNTSNLYIVVKRPN